MRVYGSCALIARDGAQVVATLRFYPTALCTFSDHGGAGFCLQQAAPAGPADELSCRDFPPLGELSDKSLFVHCFMIVPQFRRQGLATRLARELILWARGWEAIAANTYEDIPLLYSISGVTGMRFWERLGFSVVRQEIEAALEGELLDRVRNHAEAAGIPAARAANRYRMCFELQ